MARERDRGGGSDGFKEVRVWGLLGWDGMKSNWGGLVLMAWGSHVGIEWFLGLLVQERGGEAGVRQTQGLLSCVQSLFALSKIIKNEKRLTGMTKELS